MPQSAQELADGLRRQGRLSALAVSGSGFAFDPRTGQSFTLNPTALEVLEGLGAGRTLAATAERLAADYGIPAEIALASTESFVRQLGRYLS